VVAISDWTVQHNQRNVTCGQWATEPEARDELERFIRANGAFRTYRGEPLWKHHFQTQDKENFRADLLLLPNDPVIEAGWNDGAIVIEVKRSGKKIGRGISQLIDYMNGTFYIEGGIAVVPSWGFLFPAVKQAEAIASVMAQQRLGTVTLKHGELDFYCGETRVLSIGGPGDVRLGKRDIGRRLGAR